MGSRYGWLLLALLTSCSDSADRSAERRSDPAPIITPAPPTVMAGPGAPVQMPHAGAQAPAPIAGHEADADAGREPEDDGGIGDPSCPTGVFCPGVEPGCGSLRLETDVQVSLHGRLLIVFDQSISMRGAWQMTTKIDAARAALVSAITPLRNQLTLASLFLPTQACLPRTPQGGAVAAIEAPSQINFMPGADFLQAWDQHFTMLGTTAPVGTPLNEAFDRADLAIQSLAGQDLPGKLGVVVFTDGEPNCAPNPNVTGVPTMPAPERAAQWAANGINTYVVGLPGARGVDVLDQIAMSGGTMTYITPDDPAQLATTLQQVVEKQITRTFASCNIKLDPPAEFRDQLRLFVTEDGKQREVPHKDSDGSGWTVSKDGKKAKLTGQVCKDAEAGLFDSFTFDFGCTRPPPAPPAGPPD